MVQEIRSLQKLAIFQGLTLGAEGGGGACTRYFTVSEKQIRPDETLKSTMDI